jgi:endonuclease/exonuclease/phosphatase (EEP) superfamily protein YafD
MDARRSRVIRLRRASAHARALARIGYDLLHSLLRPVARAPDAGLAQCCSRPAADQQPALHEQAGQPIRIISWNIHRNYQASLLARSLAEIIAGEAPDLLLLQEVPVYSEAPFWDLAGVRELVSDYHIEYVTMHRVLRQSSHYQFEHTGLATLSRFAPTVTRAYPLPIVSRPKLGRWHRIQRVALHTTFSLGRLQLHVVNVHLENTTRPRGRHLQLRHLLDQLGDVTGPLVLGGDFNTMFGPLESVKQELLGAGFQVPRLDHQPRLLPRLDYFFVQGLRTGEGRCLAAAGSDHRAIAAEMWLV